MVADLIEQIRVGDPLRIVGGNSKSFLGTDLSALPALETSSLNELISYEPSELVVQVQAGFKVKDLVELLASENQMLAFDPADFGGSTIGGAVATGLSGSRRPYQGACRDFLLGASVIDGAGEHLNFGGQVMKNVAGYDISRLLAGSFGCLGVITEVSFKVLPKPECELTVKKAVPKDDVLNLMSKQGRLTETSATAYWQGELYVRYTGSESSVRAAITNYGGEECRGDIWRQIDALELFSAEKTVWRVSTEANHPADGLADAVLIDWGGAQRWLTGEKPELQDGYATCVKTVAEIPKFAPLPSYQMGIHQRLKDKFDPKRILNPGKMYPEF